MMGGVVGCSPCHLLLKKQPVYSTQGTSVDTRESVVRSGVQRSGGSTSSTHTGEVGYSLVRIGWWIGAVGSVCKLYER